MTAAIALFVLAFILWLTASREASSRSPQCELRRRIPGSSAVALVTSEGGKWTAAIYDEHGESKCDRWVYRETFATKEDALAALLPKVSTEAAMSKGGL